MDWRDEEFEQFLRQFQPRKPAALPHQSRRLAAWSRRFAVAAIIVLVCGSASFVRRFQRAVHRPSELRTAQEPTASVPTAVAAQMTVGRLTQVALLNPDALETTLGDASRSLLPHVERSDSTLHALAKEY